MGFHDVNEAQSVEEIKECADYWECSLEEAFSKDNIDKMGIVRGKLTDREFSNACYELFGKPQSEREYMKAMAQFQCATMKTEEIIKADADYVETMTEQEYANDQKLMKLYHPNDVVNLSPKVANMLFNLWHDTRKSKFFSVPSDLFFEDTIPLLDVKIKVDNSEFRVCIFRQFYKIALECWGNEEKVMVGEIIETSMYQNSGSKNFKAAEVVTKIYVVSGMDSVIISDPKLKVKGEYDGITGTPIHQSVQRAGWFLGIWYGVQVALLHPQVKDVFSHPRVIGEVESRHSNSRKNGKRKVKYIKIHTIDEDDLKRHMYGDGKTIERRTLVWYVVGHWRKLKNGGKTFVHPYWKGPLRDTKRPDEEREREIVIPTNLNSED